MSSEYSLFTSYKSATILLARISQQCAAQSKYKQCTSLAIIVLMSAKISELLAVDKEKGLRKRRSTTAIREEDGSRKKHAPGNKGEEIGDITKMITELRGKIKAKDMNEQKARDNGLRVEKKAQMRPRSICCRCETITGDNHNRERLECGHSHCPVYIIQNQEHLSTSEPYRR